ncbi:MAG: hypothetical protein U5R30_06645 [Deltaproteobacteria bacterium]|nr:hypothetical protein [Deltaproteobacteria bacterium]
MLACGQWRIKQLEYTWLRSLMGHHADFRQVTQDALDFSFDMHDLNDPDLRKGLMGAYLKLDCYRNCFPRYCHRFRLWAGQQRAGIT